MATGLLESLQTCFYIIMHCLMLNLTRLVWNQNYEIDVVFNGIEDQYFFELSTCSFENLCLSDSHEVEGFASDFER